MKDETTCEGDVKMDAVVAEPSTKERACNVDDFNELSGRFENSQLRWK